VSAGEANYGPSGYPTARIEAMRIYEPAHDRFFDSLVEFFSSFAGLMTGLRAHQEGSAKAYGTHQAIVIYGTHATGVALSFFPHFFLDALSNNTWPTEIRLAEFPLSMLQGNQSGRITSVARIAAALLESSFIRYYEQQKVAVSLKYGADARAWPDDWNFARAVRNAFAHRGAINFDNPKASSVHWRNLSYSRKDNGRIVTFTDITPVEIILLMEDLDALL
jgi:hypothetical protein